LRQRRFTLGRSKIRDGGKLELHKLAPELLCGNQSRRGRQHGNARGKRKKPENPLDHDRF
jgi:hypothetical protein